jgi:hypothetical protein
VAAGDDELRQVASEIHKQSPLELRAVSRAACKRANRHYSRLILAASDITMFFFGKKNMRYTHRGCSKQSCAFGDLARSLATVGDAGAR